MYSSLVRSSSAIEANAPASDSASCRIGCHCGSVIMSRVIRAACASVCPSQTALTRVQNRASSSVWGMTFTASRCWATRPVSVMTTASSADMETGTIST